MQIVTFNDFGFKGSEQIPTGNWRAVGIAPSSLVDICEVNGFRLGPGSLVPVQSGQTVKAIRGWRSGALGTADSGAEQANNVRNLSTLSLVLFETCDELVPPGPRASWRGGAVLEMGLVNKLAVRAPFSGRKSAIVAVRGEDGVTAVDTSFIVRGVRYLPREFLATVLETSQNYQPFVEQATTETLFNGGGAIATSTVDPDIPSPNLLGRIVYYGGGGDNQEGFDELEVWVVGGGQSVVYVDVEVNGERG